MNESNGRMRRRWHQGVALGIVALLGAGTAQAQSTSADPAQETVDDGQLADIVVTAQRRSENIQEVPLSVAILPSERLQTIFDSGNDITALATRVPGLYAESSNGRVAPRFYIRGLGNTDFDLAASQPVSVIVDEVVLENVSLKSFPLFDIERVEVLRGPQGTLFGRNTPAGIIKFDTVKPSNDFSAQGSLSFGTFGSLNFDGGVGAPIVKDVLAARVSFLIQRRENWIDNGFRRQDDVYGAYEERAVRGQLLFTPIERLSILGNLHYRNLESFGGSAIFRANILGPGNNELNQNYDRDRVFLDAGGGNRQAYRGTGGSLRVDYEADFATITSISAYESSEGSSRADVDGGFGAAFLPVSGPGFIPFPSDTQDSIDLEQRTQEVRLASNGTGRLGWQVGAFFFDSDFTVLTQGFDFPPPTLVRHRNESWAVFGQASYKLTEALKLTGGARYTDDRKLFNVIGGSPLDNREVSDERVSWDVSAFYEVTPEFSIYGRVADGFRAPSIQGRDVAFFAPPSVAASETILSWEGGFKSELFNRRVRLNGAAFTYSVNNPQFTAVGGGGNLVQLLNANEANAWGFELDGEFRVTERFTLTAGFSYNDTEINDDTLAVGICAQCTVTDPTVTIAGTRRALVDGNPFPNAPEWIGDFTARYAVPVKGDAELFVFTDWAFQGPTNFFLYESREFNSDTQFEGGLRIGYAKQDGSLEIAAFARNITDEDNVKGGIDFNNNTAFVNEPRIIGLSLRTRIN